MSRVLLIGAGPTATTAFQSLAERLDLVGVVRRAEPGDEVTRLAASAGIPVFHDTSVKSIERRVEELGPDCVVVSTYDRIFRPELLARCRFVNVHYAPLPEYRGRATVNWAILNRRPQTALTIHVMAPQLDGGAILFQQFVPIGPDDTVADLYSRLNAIQFDVLGRTVETFLGGGEGRVQDPARASYTCTRIPDDGEIDWTWPTEQIYALVRALVSPFPGAFTYIGGERLLVWQAIPAPHPPPYAGRVPGRVVAVDPQGFVDVLTGDGVLRLLEVQVEGGEPSSAAKVIRSVRATLGLRSADLLSRIRSLEQKVRQLSETPSRLQDSMTVTGDVPS